MTTAYCTEKTQVQRNYDAWIGRVIDFNSGTVSLDSFNAQINYGLRRNKFAPTIVQALELRDKYVFTEPYKGRFARPGINCVVYAAALAYQFVEGRIDDIESLKLGINFKSTRFHAFGNVTDAKGDNYDTELCYGTSPNQVFLPHIRKLFDSTLLIAEKSDPYLECNSTIINISDYASFDNQANPEQVDGFIYGFSSFIDVVRRQVSQSAY